MYSGTVQRSRQSANGLRLPLEKRFLDVFGPGLTGQKIWKPPRFSSKQTLSRVSSRPRECAPDGVHRFSGGAAAFARAWELQCSAFAALQHRCIRAAPCLAKRNKLSERRWASERDILACQAFFGASATFGPLGHVFPHSSCGAHRHRVTQCECWLDHVVQWPSRMRRRGRRLGALHAA